MLSIVKLIFILNYILFILYIIIITIYKKILIALAVKYN